MDDILQIAICSGLNFSYNPSTEKRALSQCPRNSKIRYNRTCVEWLDGINKNRWLKY